MWAPVQVMVTMVPDRVEATYRRVHDRLWRALLSYCGDPEVASDAESEAFAQALARGDAIENLESWVWRSSFKIANGMLATRSPLTAVPDRPDGSIPFSAVEFLDELSELSPQQRACIVLRYVAQFEPAGIADILDTTPNTVSVQLHRAHSALRLDRSTARDQETR